MATFCLCVSGLHQSCNHIAALLFRMDAAWKAGATNPACTSLPCSWKQPGKTKALLQNKRICELDFAKPSYNPKVRKDWMKNRMTSAATRKHQYSSNISLRALVTALEDAAPDAVVHTVYPYSKVHNKYVGKVHEIEVSTSHQCLPPSPFEVAKETGNIDSFVNSCTELSLDQVICIEKQTIGQSKNQLWKAQRQGRLTASDFHDIRNKVKSFKDHATAPEVKKYILALINRSDNLGTIPAIKYGRAMEDQAKVAFIGAMEEAGHMNVTTKECGLFVDPVCAYIGASPDLLVSCECCGESVVEIKCPYSCASDEPKEGHPTYLIKPGNTLELKKTHKYYTQVQGQMGVCIYSRCFFFVYAPIKPKLIKIVFDPTFWSALQADLKVFFTKCMAPHLIEYVQSECETTTEMNTYSAEEVEKRLSSTNVDHPYQNNTANTMSTAANYATGSTDAAIGKTAAAVGTVTGVKKGKKIAKKPSREPSYTCDVCHKVCPSKPANPVEFSIQCDMCQNWFHFPCVNVTCDSPQIKSEKWLCPLCF